ncbi:MAG: flippase, partial [Candidatus Micrarchaeota archaeon]|nr:flippase [Candidatus Micrarchaeota archaeon]
MEVDEDIHTIARGTVWQSAASVLFKLTSFIYTILIARLVVQEEVGLFYFALGIVGLVGMFADLGLNNAISRFIPYYIGRGDKRKVYHIACVSLFFGSLLPLAITALLFLGAHQIASFFGNPALERLLELFSVQIILVQAYNMLSALLVSYRKVKEASLATNIQNLSKLLLTVALIYTLGADAASLSIAYMISFFLCGAYLLYQSYGIIRSLPTPKDEKPSEYFSALGEIAPFGLAMVGVVFVWNLIGYTDRVMLGYYLGEAASQPIAVYSIATGLASIIGIFSATVISIFFPVVSELVGREEREKIRKTSATAIKWVLFLSVPIAAFFIAFSAPLLSLLYGAEYAAGSVCLVLFSLGALANLAGMPQKTVLAGMRLVGVELKVVGIAAVLNVALNALLIPPYGINGASVASAAAFVLMAFLNQHYAGKFAGVSFPPSAWKNLFTGALVLAFLLLLSSVAQAPALQLGEGLAGLILN